MRRFLPGKKTLLWTLALATLVGGIALWQRERLLSWHYIQQLASADEASREVWVNRIVGLGEPCLPGLVSALQGGDASVCANVEAALAALALHWGPADERTQELVAALGAAFPGCRNEGRATCLEVTLLVLEGQPKGATLAGALAKSAAQLLAQARQETPLLVPALRLARAFLGHVPAGQGADLCRELALKGLEEKTTPARLAAARVLLQAPFKQDHELLAKLVPLLKAKEPELRKAALVAVARDRELVEDDDLLLLLHDADLEVQYICEQALRSRGLTDGHIHMGRLISDPRPGVRLHVLEHLDRAADLEPGVWLRRLSQDAAPAVRAAAVRAAAGEKLLEMKERLGEMAREDPSPTVRQLAAFYLSRGLSRIED